VPRVLVRVVTSPAKDRGERLVVWVDLREVNDPDVLLYSLTKDTWDVKSHRKTMWRTRRANPTEHAEAVETLAQIGLTVRVLQSAPHARVTDEMPAQDEDPDENDGT
jgi:hypothetical protein